MGFIKAFEISSSGRGHWGPNSRESDSPEKDWTVI